MGGGKTACSGAAERGPGTVSQVCAIAQSLKILSSG